MTGDGEIDRWMCKRERIMWWYAVLECRCCLNDGYSGRALAFKACRVSRMVIIVGTRWRGCCMLQCVGETSRAQRRRFPAGGCVLLKQGMRWVADGFVAGLLRRLNSEAKPFSIGMGEA